MVVVPYFLNVGSPNGSTTAVGKRAAAAVREYSEWHAAEVDDENLKNDYRKAGQVSLKNGLDGSRSLIAQIPTFLSKGR
jgi:hypothetical protein